MDGIPLISRKIGFAAGTAIFVTAFLLLGTATVQAKTIHVDLSLGSNCLTAYNPTVRSCGGGTDTGFNTLGGGLSAVQPGDALLLRSGTYGQLMPPGSGTQEKPITIQNYPGEVARIANLSGGVALSVIGRSDLIIKGITVENVLGFGRLEDSTRIAIEGMNFKAATSTGTTGGLKLVRSTFNRIVNNSFLDGNDSLLLQDASDHNLVEQNLFTNARHSLLSVRCSNFNMVRGNTFSNPSQKAVEIYDCEGVSDAPVRLDSTKYNVFEGNRFLQTAASDREYRYNAIQHGAQHTIVRNNLFRGCLGGGVNYQYYSDESLFVYGNRMYNNTFFQNRCYAIIGNSGSSSQYYDNLAANNLLYKNTACDGSATQVLIGNSNVVKLVGNALATADPLFVDESANDFNLAPTSPYIDKGRFVTSAIGSGSGMTLRVVDAGYFYDGFGIPGETGDMIQLSGQQSPARILSINYSSNILTVDRSVTWTDGQGIHLKYSGQAPDLGALEYGAVSTLLPPYQLRLLP